MIFAQNKETKQNQGKASLTRAALESKNKHMTT